ncbi:AAA family ATPase [Halococcus sp. AFM35]|uniref:AAA family ATPase n=1 Tax=Halococcus sp. AFM35 TaxID=3421653 RepID=UPI003EB70F10
MELTEARIQNYKCIDDSGWVDFERVTCFVGKNESGKTAFLQALEKLNPVDSTGNYDPLEEYPRRYYTRYKTRHEADPDIVASARYDLSSQEIEDIESEYGKGVLATDTVEVTKDYQNNLHWNVEINEEQIVQKLLGDYELHNSTQQSLSSATTLEELWTGVEDSEASSNEFSDLMTEVQALRGGSLDNELGENILRSYLPQFLYFDEYSIMEGDVYLDHIREKQRQSNLSDSDETFLSLLSIANLDLDDFSQIDDYEGIIAELEAASNYISEQVFEYWTQGPNLRVEFDKSNEESDDLPDQNPNQAQNQNQNQPQEKQPVLHVRIYNDQHKVTLPFDERSRGFVWFFSFLAYFGDMENDNRELVLLLDEPGLNLHAKAQHDFLRFINDRLAPNHPVAYTTHSPFMLEPERLHRSRLVIDDPESSHEGTEISDDILGSDEDTLFPLQAVLGYDLIRTLLIGPECLLVEGKSDMIYLQVMSDILDRKDRTPLSHRWTIVPVNGADNVPTFVSLFGASNLTIGVLLDDDSRIDQRLREIEERSVLDLDHVKTVSEFIDKDEGDTEDLFSEDFYASVVSEAYGFELRAVEDVPDTISLSDFQSQHPRITNQFESYFERWHVNEGTFRHHDPASELQKKRDYFEERIDEETVDRFEELFKDMNSIIDAE